MWPYRRPVIILRVIGHSDLICLRWKCTCVLYVHVCMCAFICMYVCLCVSIGLSVRLSVCLPVFLSLSLTLSLTICILILLYFITALTLNSSLWYLVGCEQWDAISWRNFPTFFEWLQNIQKHVLVNTHCLHVTHTMCNNGGTTCTYMLYTGEQDTVM